jgi:(E)-4-hydroxy-3-methylbut-2-enyl-diphosphate synthase
LDYTANPFRAERRSTRVVRVGDVAIGGDNRIRIQSMTTTDTLDTEGTVQQCERLVAAGCEIVRITAPSIREAENLAEIADLLKKRGVSVPLVADIHFTPNAAMIAALHVDKVRINPGNYADRKKFEVREYSDAEYDDELARIGERFRPLVLRCRERGIAMRIGTNHGSLSDRIMNRFGDTPLGMVESALEFLGVCEAENYRDVIFSMKSSNPQVAIQAYRLLAARLAEAAPGEASYPLHVGVTEAGDGEDGRIKSAIGIGALLEDGIGDTIRVSLTEDPVREVPVAFAIARRAEAGWQRDRSEPAPPLPIGARYLEDAFSHARRATRPTAAGGLRIGGDEPVRVELELGALPDDSFAPRLATALALQPELPCEGLRVAVADIPALGRVRTFASELARLGLDVPIAIRLASGASGASAAEWIEALRKPAGASRLALPIQLGDKPADMERATEIASETSLALEWCIDAPPIDIPALVARALDATKRARATGVVISLASPRLTHAARIAVAVLSEHGAGDVPLILRHEEGSASDGESLLGAAIALGGLLCDGIGDAVCVTAAPDPSVALDLAYRILQGARLRTTRTEYISCPSCGRTLFDLEETTARVKAKTDHLKGVKIAVMGCIVNGPGEMADADFGYVGAGTARVNLYVGKEVVARGVDEADAPDRLVDIIRQHGAWREPA